MTMTAPRPTRDGVFAPGVRVRHGHHVGRIVMWWLDGKWAVQLPHHPKGSYTLLHPSQMTVVDGGAS